MSIYADCSEKDKEQKSVLGKEQSNGTITCGIDNKEKSGSSKEIIKCDRCKKALKPIKQDMKGWKRKLHKKCWKEEREYAVFLDVCKGKPYLFFDLN